VVLGFAAVLSLTAGLMLWIKWLGAAYLIWLGIRAWRSPVDGPEVPAPRREPSAPAFWQGLGIAIINPKTLMFNAAFLPQFVPDGSGPVQLAIFGLIYLTVLFAGDLLWAAFADRARRLFGKFSHLRNKVEGGFLVGAGAGLALARIRE